MARDGETPVTGLMSLNQGSGRRRYEQAVVVGFVSSIGGRSVRMGQQEQADIISVRGVEAYEGMMGWKRNGGNV